MKEETARPDNQQEVLPIITPEAWLPAILEHIPAEVSFENIGYFTPSSKRIKGITTKEKVVAERTNPDGTAAVLTVQIIGTGKYGLPTTSDLDYYRALLKILDEITDQTGQIPEPISLPTKKLIRYAGKQANARAFQEIKDWIRRCHFTGIQGFFYKAEKGDYVEIGNEPLFPKYLIRGQKMDNGQTAETNYVWLASWFRSNYLHHHLRPIDLAFHIRLRKPIAKSLYPLLELGWYASDGAPYAKSYSSLCQEFLLKECRYISHIKQQLDPSHGELQREHFLAQWEYRKAANGQDWIISYYPGVKFFEDQKAREARRQFAEQLANRARLLPYTQLDLLDRTYPLLADILTVCGDAENKAAYQKIVREYPESLLRMALSETRQAHLEGRIRKNKGAFFMETVKQLARLRVGT